MTHRVLLRLIPAVLMTAAAGYLFSLFPKTNTPDYVYEWAPLLVGGVVLLIVETLLLTRQSPADARSGRKVWDDVGDRTWVAWTRRRSVGAFLAALGGLTAWTTGDAADFHGTVSRLSFAEVTITIGFAAFSCWPLIPWTPRRAGRALLVLAGLLLVLGALAPLVRPLGPAWRAGGLRPTYFLLGSAVLVLAAGIVALIEAGHLDEAPDLHAAEADVP